MVCLLVSWKTNDHESAAERKSMDLTTIALLLLFLGAGAAAGLTGGVMWMRERGVAGADRTVMTDTPEQWPLKARGLVTTGEVEVWNWLRTTFPDHHVLIKVPVLRFTTPMERDRKQREKWLTRLSAVYTTFAVCSADGTVLGCVDVPGKRGLDQRRRELKEALLADCHIAYTVGGAPGQSAPARVHAGGLSG